AAPVTKVVLEAAIAARDAALDRRRLAEVPQRAASLMAAVPDSVRSADTAARAAETERTPFVFDLGVPLDDAQRKPVVTSRRVPDVDGLSTRLAVRELHRAGFRVRLD